MVRQDAAMTITDLLPPTRFCGLPRLATGAILAGLLLVIAVGIVGGVAHDHHPPVDVSHSDLGLYKRVIGDIDRGLPYYSAVTAEHRQGHYPLKPAYAVRNPLLATAMAALPDDGARTLSLRILAILVLAVWGWRLHFQFGRPVLVGAGMLLLGYGMPAALIGGLYPLHDIWAGTLIALSLGLYDPRRWLPSVMIGFVAVVLRELSLGYLVAMGTMALFDGKRREALAWAVAIVAFFGVFAVHAHLLAAELKPGDLASQGWLGFGGWPFVLATSKWNALLVLAPPWLIATVVPLMLLGLAGWPGPLGVRLALICFGYNFAFLVFGRSDNFYWGLIIAPLMMLGLLMAPVGLWDLARSAMHGCAGGPSNG
jgi:hypothetical protein